MNEENQINYYAIIPATVRYDKNLKSSEKLMYSEITALTNKSGYCFANNRYFANLYDVSIHTVSQWISHLEKLGYIIIELIRDDKKEIKERRIYINDISYVQKNTYPYVSKCTYPYVSKCTYPYVSKCTYPMYKKVQDNNKDYKIDRLFNFVIKKEKEIPEEISKIDIDKLYLILDRLEMNYTEEILKYYTKDNIKKIKIIIYSLVQILNNYSQANLFILTRERLFLLYDKCKCKEDDIFDFVNYYITCILKEIYKP